MSFIQEEDRCRLRAALVAAQTLLTEKSNQITRAYASLQLVVKPLQTKVIALEAQVVDLSRALEVQQSKLHEAERQLSKAAAARNILIENFTQLQSKSTDIVSHIMRQVQEIQEQAQRKQQQEQTKQQQEQAKQQQAQAQLTQQQDYPKGVDETHLTQQHQGDHKGSPNYSERMTDLWHLRPEMQETGQDADLTRTTRSVEHVHGRTERRPGGRETRATPPLLESHSAGPSKQSPSPSKLRPTVLTTRQATRENVLCGVGLVLGRMASEENTTQHTLSVTTGGQSDIRVLHLVPGSPAALSQKIQLEDRLSKIDNVRVASQDNTHVAYQVQTQMREEGLRVVSSLEDVFRLISGVEGSHVTFEFARALKGGASARGTHYTFTVTLLRQKGDSYWRERSPAVAPFCSGARNWDYLRDDSRPKPTPKSFQPKSFQLEPVQRPGVYEDYHYDPGGGVGGGASRGAPKISEEKARMSEESLEHVLAPGRVGSGVLGSRGRYTGAGEGNDSSAGAANALLHQPGPLSWTQVRERVHAQNEANALVRSTTARAGGRLPSAQVDGAVRVGSIAGEGGGD